jgi:hypothetical protein
MLKRSLFVVLFFLLIIVFVSSCLPPPPDFEDPIIAVCDNGILEGNEQCDNGSLNGVTCTPPTGGSCTYCSNDCKLITLEDADFWDGADGGDTTGKGIGGNGVNVSGALRQMPSLTKGLRDQIKYDPRLTGPQPGVIAPENAIIIHPTDDANSIIHGKPAGTIFFFKEGVHRGISVSGSNLKDGMQFIGEYGAILNGAELLSGFVKEGDLWVMKGRPYKPSVYELGHFKQPGETGYSTGTCRPATLRCDFWADLFLDDKPLRHVDMLSKVNGTGTWFYDYEAGIIYMYDNPTGRKVEIGKTFWAISNGEQPGEDNGARDIVVKNLVIEKYRTQQQRAVIRARFGFDWIIENNEIRYNHAVGVNLGTGSILRNNIIHTNGQMGISAHGLGVLIENNEIAHNNHAGYNWGWEAGGSKFVKTTDLVVRHNYAHDNDGPGLWSDISNENVLFEYNVADDNNGPGLFHEISYSATIRYNIARDNYYGHHGSGVRISTSGPVKVYGNEIIVRGPVNGIGTHAIGISNDNRTPWSYGRAEIYDNKIAIRTSSGRAIMFWLRNDLQASQDLVNNCNAFIDRNTYYIIPSRNELLFNRPSLTSYYGDNVDITGWRTFCGFDVNGQVIKSNDPVLELY